MISLYQGKSGVSTINFIRQRRNIEGRFILVENYKDTLVSFILILRDLFGMDSWGLASLIQSSGLSKIFSEEKTFKTNFR